MNPRITVLTGAAAVVFLLWGAVTPEPYNGVDLTGSILGFITVVRAIWVATETPTPDDCPQSHASRNDA